ncbi:hypothetical protein AGABI1DRAFT_85532 [Agaricus bisporus var. burnettii JB137-S8]|uniref:Uncharacterized protein n=2 Tax=Agaricus bisporus var. burnettii TaxID=192524 RepID=K5X622_AGABU|nr:uncharacterized protein AGABI1DRAFT_85532 [Agaricus bisporus var. burnettii JB137-S8]EKM78608.1 hypothetical protein AGABI1DRAFT_85532 [Agaricus bisporus var. burnettii JB137-S8]KAF7773348.1 hypothetical protein Agabi119p4_5515 [Agaricus bisporus var. burnettii]
MFFFRAICALTALTATLAEPIIARQNGNTNQQISDVLDPLAVQTRNNLFLINTLQANQTASDETVGVVVQQMVAQYNDAASALGAIPPSTGSDTVQPTDIELSRVFGETLQIVGTGFSGLEAQGSVPNFGNMVSQLDPAVAATATALSQVSSGSLEFAHILLLDVSQFFVAMGVWPETLAVMGF